MRLGPRRNLASAWKAIIDSLVAILGRRPGKKEFDIEDGRIVSLSLHRSVDDNVGDHVHLMLWWRAATGVVSHGPRLTYDVGATVATTDASRPSGIAGKRLSQPGGSTIATVEQFRGAKRAGVGYVINRDRTRNTLHRWSCRYVSEADFSRKVIDGGFNDGYVNVTDCATATTTWPHLHPCGVCAPPLSPRAP